MAIKQKNLYKDDTAPGYRLVGVADTAANYLLLDNRSAAIEGDTWYDATANVLKTHDGTNWSVAGLNSQSAGSLDDAANLGVKITLDGSIGAGIELEATDAAIATNGQLLLLDNNDTSDDIHCIEIDTESTAAAIQIDVAADSTVEINGTSSAWSVRGDGQIDCNSLSLGDSNYLYLGGTARTGDVTLHFVDGVAVGTASGGLLVEAVGTDECIQFGDGSSYNFDIWFSGDTSTGNKCYWDMDGGINSVGALQLDNADVLMGDSDAIVFGDGYDLIMQSGGASIVLTTSTDNTTIQIGDGTKNFDIYWYGDTTSQYILFDQSGKVVDFIDTDLMLNDDARLFIGSGDDWSIGGTSALSFLPQTAGDTASWTVGDSAGTKVSDLNWYTTTNGAGFYIDASADQVYLDLADLKLGDDDYILLGDSATAGGTADGTIRWDESASTVEVIGNTIFEDAVIIDGNLTVSGILSVTGAWDPTSFLLTDNEYIYFGTGPDFKVVHQQSTINTLQISANLDNDRIRFGDGVVDGDIIYAENADTSGANFWWDGSGEELFFGKSGDGIDCTWYSETANSYMKWNQDGSTNVGQLLMEDSTIVMMDDTKLLFGDGATAGAGDWQILSSGTNLIISEVSAAAKMVQFGAVNEGCLVRFYGDTDGYNCTWNCTNDALFFADNAEIGVGGSAGTHDLTIASDGTSAYMTLGTNLCFSGNGKNMLLGASGAAGTDVTLQAASSAGVDVKWDAGNETLSFDGSILAFDGGTASAPQYTIQCATTSKTLQIAADDSSTCKLQFGTSAATTNGMDVVFMDGSGIGAITWDAASTTFTVADPTSLVFSGSDVNYNINHIAGAQELQITGADNSGAQIVFGISGTNGTNVEFRTAAASGTGDIIFDAGATTFTIQDPAQLVFAGSGMGYTANLWTDSATLRIEPQFDSTLAKIAFGTSTASLTNGLDVEFCNKSGQSAVKWDCGTTAFTIADPSQLVFSGSGMGYTANLWTDSATLRIEPQFDSSLAKIAFGTSTASLTNGLDVELCNKSGQSAVKWDCGATTFTIADPTQLVFSGSDCNYTINHWTDSSTLRIQGSDDALAKIAFGTSAASTHGLDIAFCDASGIEAINWDAATTTFTFNNPTSLVFGASDVDYTFNLGVAPSSTTALVINATDTSYAKVEFGLKNGESTNGLDVVFCSATGDSNLTWDAGAGTLSTAASGVSIVGVAASGVWEHALILPSTNSAPTTSTATGSGAIVYSHDSSALYIFTGSSWIKTAAGALTS